MSRKEKRKAKYHQLIDAGFDYKMAQYLKDRKQKNIDELCELKRTQDVVLNDVIELQTAYKNVYNKGGSNGN